MVKATSNDMVVQQLIEYLARRRGYRWKKNLMAAMMARRM